MTDDELRAKQENILYLQQLEEQPGWGVMRYEIATRAEKLQNRILAGGLSSGEYERMCGVLQGMKTVTTVKEALISEVEAAIRG